jgi:hypothetical protein
MSGDSDDETESTDEASVASVANQGHSPTRKDPRSVPSDHKSNREDDEEEDDEDDWPFTGRWEPRYEGDMRLATGNHRAVGQAKLKMPLYFCPSPRDLLEEHYYTNQKTDDETYNWHKIMRYWKRTASR